VRRRRGARAPQQASGWRFSGGLRRVGLGRGRRQRGAGRAEKISGWTRGPGEPPATSSSPESSGLLDSGPRHKIVLQDRGRTVAKFKRLNLTALAGAEGRGGKSWRAGRGWGGPRRVSRGGKGGAWQASLLFWLARAQKVEHVVSWARPSFERPPPHTPCGCGDCCIGVGGKL
jgi:hypothetical protein